jgi:glycerophosphoryl diester phosphodiesterase
MNTLLNIAHRGARAYAPENTLSAFAKAKTFDCQMIELDVRLSKDGVVIVHHDENLSRCTDIQTRNPERSHDNIWEFTFSELQAFDAGSWYLAELELPSTERQTFLQNLTDFEIAEYVSDSDKRLYGSGQVKIPALAETLELVNKLGLMINIELKSPCQDPQGLITGVLAMIHEKNLTKQVIISSFDHNYLKLVRKHDKTVAIAVLADPLVAQPMTLLRQLKSNTFNLGCFWEFPTLGFDSQAGRAYLKKLAKLKKSAVAINIWTCNNPLEMEYLLAIGVTGLISDYPNRVHQAISNYSNKGSEILSSLVQSGIIF